MKIYHQPVELIVESVPFSAKAKGTPNIKQQLANADIPVTKMTVSARNGSAAVAKKGVSPTTHGNTYLKTAIRDSEENPWDVAHRANQALANHPFVEPDQLHEFIADRNADAPFKKVRGGPPHGDELGFDPDWMPYENIIWHLDSSHSQLADARRLVESIGFNVVIGHLDTGIDKKHDVIPQRIKEHRLQRNFVDGERKTDAQDPFVRGALRNPGHGLATMAILAGGKVKLKTTPGVFQGELGGAPFADVIPCRIASSVVLMKTSAFAEALNYLTDLALSGKPVHIVSMSMGGAPAKVWADAVNRAYDAGITIISAAGNNFNGLPTRHLVYPARFNRVIAACGVTFDKKPYRHEKVGEMQGCYGPEKYMESALAAFTPNTPWAQANTKNKISFSGAGTSSATPQIAAAAAIYYRKYHEQLGKLKPWQRVEAIRNALFSSAEKTVNGSNGNYSEFFGNGILRAKNALDIVVGTDLAKTPEDKVPFFPVLTTLFKSRAQQRSPKLEMLNTELAQLTFNYPELEQIIGADFSNATEKDWNDFTEAVIAHPASSLALKEHILHTTMGKPIKISRSGGDAAQQKSSNKKNVRTKRRSRK